MSEKVALPTAEVEDMREEWQKCRDAISGQKAIKKAGETYLPKLSGQDAPQYEKYKKQALYFNASGRTHKSFLGMIFRKDPDYKLPESMEAFIEDVDRKGNTLDEYGRSVVSEELETSRIAVLVEYPSTVGQELSVAEAEEQGIQPYLVSYKAEDILGYKERRIGNKTVLTQVRLKESSPVNGDDEFEEVIEQRVRVLDLTLEDSDGNETKELKYRQRVFVKTDKDWIEDEKQRQFPLMKGKFITEIPFFCVGGLKIREPEMIDLVNVNISHYISDADHRAGVAWTTRPQPWATGINDDELVDATLGGGELWTTRNTEGDFGMLEYSGNGLKASENQINKLEDRMSVLGARMLTNNDQKEQSATEFVGKKQGENSALSFVADRVSKTLTEALKFVAKWMGLDDADIEYRLNKDYVPVGAKPDDIIKMITAVQTGKYTQQDYLWWLEQNEVIDPSIDLETRQSEMETSKPTGLDV